MECSKHMDVEAQLVCLLLNATEINWFSELNYHNNRTSGVPGRQPSRGRDLMFGRKRIAIKTASSVEWVLAHMAPVKACTSEHALISVTTC